MFYRSNTSEYESIEEFMELKEKEIKDTRAHAKILIKENKELKAQN